MSKTAPAANAAALASMLESYSAEITARDKKGIEAAPDVLPKGAELFIAAIPGETVDRIVAAATQLRKVGLVPVPHIVARNLHSAAELDDLLERLVGEAGLDRALVLGGDRDKPEGPWHCSLQILQSGLLQKHGIKKIFLASYPEGHPRVADEVLRQALDDKLAFTGQEGFDVTLVSQFCFAAEPIVDLARDLRARGIEAPLRVGVAGPADHATLMKYALMCGVGASLRALRERQDLARNMMSGETPEALLTEVALARESAPALNITGTHFFTFGALAKSANFARAARAG